MATYVLGLRDVDTGRIALVGGKGAGLGALARIDEVRVPDGFCVTTRAFARVLAETPAIREPLDRLARLGAGDREGLRAASAELRALLEGVAIPAEVADAIVAQLAILGVNAACAVRSSATAEDLPTSSFAGQHDTYLDVVGPAAVLEHVRRCWASLFSERAVAYRAHHGFDHRRVQMAVVVQKLVVPRASGVLFTADPVTSNRKVAAIEATPGLGEALVAGLVEPDSYRVRDGAIVERRIASTREAAVLTDIQVAELDRLGRRIEAHFAEPQDLEWCLADDAFHVVQSRPITTLYPVPDVGDGADHVFISVGHQQMMTDAMRPLGLSLFQLTTARPMYPAGGRLFVDVTKELASPARRAWVGGMGRADPLLGDALTTVLERGESVEAAAPPVASGPPPGLPAPMEVEPEVVAELIAATEAEIQALEREIPTRSGVELFDFIREDIGRMTRGMLDPRCFAAILAGMNAAAWLNEHLLDWLGERNAADTLSQSAPDNVTSAMGLALLDLADTIRPHPEVVAYLQDARDEGFLEGLLPLAGGRAAHDAFTAWLDRYGVRCAGEIDVTRPRWRERPTALVPLILHNVRTFEPGAGGRRFQRGLEEAARMEESVLDRLARLPDGDRKVDETRRMIRRLRGFVGYREYPKYSIVRRYFLYKQALSREAAELVRAGVLHDGDDLYHLTFHELREVVRTRTLDAGLVARRRAEHARHEKLTPPRVITSDGEIVTGAYKRAGVPAGALVGLAVSAGVVEGRARVLRDMAAADLAEGDILVTAFTDPSWTPAFLAVKGLVTEVGGLMTHGSVIAREYGLPAVVGVEGATRRIVDGQRIRVHGTEGYVELLP